MDSTLTRIAALLALAVALPAAGVNHDTVVGPLAPGRFAVACSNIEQDASRLALLGGNASDYWEGRVVDGRARYITEILAQPSAALQFLVDVPDVRRTWPGYAGARVPFVAIVCHPTPRANGDADYALPGGGIVPHMQLRGAAPRLVTNEEYFGTLGAPLQGVHGAPARLPLIIHSHGLSGSPISAGYLDVMVQLAAQGYMVGAVFHGDARFSRVRIGDLDDFFYLLFQYDHVVEMQLMRPLALKAMTDVLVSTPGYSQAIDTARIGAFGASLGGQAVAHLVGARITTNLDKDCGDAPRDIRIRAAVGYVPFAGYSFLPVFCDDQLGAATVDRPYLALTGSEDTTAPQKMMEQALNRFQSSRYLVSLAGGRHELRSEDADDLFTWMLTFFNAYMDVQTDPGAMARLIKMARVTGGRDETLVVDVHVPFPAANGEVTAREFYNTRLDHFFIAAGQDEIDAILRGAAGPDWLLTGEAFKAWPRMPSDTFTAVAPVCRFYGGLNGGPNSHFFTASAAECELVKRQGGWFYEGIGFYILPVDARGQCPTGMLQVNRAYNRGFVRNDSNHRFSTSDSTMREMARHGWAVEGAVMCARP